DFHVTGVQTCALPISRRPPMEAINLSRKFSLFQDYWSPKIVGELNDAYVKLVKVKGEFVWHHHEAEDELFLVVKGRLRIRLRDQIGRASCREGGERAV